MHLGRIFRQKMQNNEQGMTGRKWHFTIAWNYIQFLVEFMKLSLYLSWHMYEMFTSSPASVCVFFLNLFSRNYSSGIYQGSLIKILTSSDSPYLEAQMGFASFYYTLPSFLLFSVYSLFLHICFAVWSLFSLNKAPSCTFFFFTGHTLLYSIYIYSLPVCC